MNINSTGTKADLSLIGKTGPEKKKKQQSVNYCSSNPGK